MRDESGNVTVLSIMFMTSLALALVLALEFSCVYAERTAYDNCLNIAREETFTTGFSMELKNSPDPWDLLSNKLVSSLRSNNYQGGITIWFYEATEQEIETANPAIDSAENVRSLAYLVQLDADYKTVVAPAQWLAGLVIRNETSAAICPYALFRTYKPEGLQGTLWCYRAEAGSSSCSKRRCDKGEMTPGMRSAVEESLRKPTEIAEDNQ